MAHFQSGFNNSNIAPIPEEDKFGFFDLPFNSKCMDLQHEPPSHLHIPQGKGYRHICPSCGKVTTLISLQIM